MHRLLIRTAVTGVAVTALVGVASPAFANDCFNISRNPNPTGGATVIHLTSGDVVYVQGHWVNFDGQGWGKIMPGTQDFMGSGISFNGNYTNGASDELGMHAVENPVHVHDLHATILYLMGLNHEKLTYRYAGRDFRLTDVHGNVAREIIA